MLPAPAVGPLLGVPVDPDADEARRWAEEELAKAVYDDSPGLVERIVEWLGDLLGRIGETGPVTPSALVPTVVVVGLVVLLVVVRVLGGRFRRARAAASSADSLFDDDSTSADLVAAADEAARRGDHAAAVLNRFRAVVRSLDERGLLDDRPGLTAHEATELASGALPGLAGALRRAGRIFDDVRYGHAAATAADDAVMRELWDDVRAARPSRSAAVGAGTTSSGSAP